MLSCSQRPEASWHRGYIGAIMFTAFYSCANVVMRALGRRSCTCTYVLNAPAAASDEHLASIAILACMGGIVVNNRC